MAVASSRSQVAGRIHVWTASLPVPAKLRKSCSYSSICARASANGTNGTSKGAAASDKKGHSYVERAAELRKKIEATRQEQDELKEKMLKYERELLMYTQLKSYEKDSSFKNRVLDSALAEKLEAVADESTVHSETSSDASSEDEQQEVPSQTVAETTPLEAAAPVVSAAAKSWKKSSKKSKRMMALAAGAGALRVAQSEPVVASRETSTSQFNGNSQEPNSLGSNNTSDSTRSAAASPMHTAPPSSDGLSPEVSIGPTAVAMSSSEEALMEEAVVQSWEAPSPLENDPQDVCVMPKPIFIISDCTGESAARTVRAALGQFELCFKTRAPATLLVFRFLETEEKAYKLIKKAAEEDALVVYTLVDPSLVTALQTACKLYQVRYVDLWSNLLDNMEMHLQAVRSGVPLSSPRRQSVLTEDYFRLIEAVEYTRKMDDGANPAQWKHADLLILGVSRCGKTPLSIYLGQRGYKVANLPLVPNCGVPKELADMPPSKVVGLVIDPAVLSSIRRNRLWTLGVGRDSKMEALDYAESKAITAELEWAKRLYEKNPGWVVLDVTFRGVEETAAKIMKIMAERRVLPEGSTGVYPDSQSRL